MNPEFLNLKEAAEEAEFEEVNPQSNKLQNAGLSGTHTPKFDQAQYEANRSSDLIMSQKHLGDQEKEQTPFDRIRGMMRHGNTKSLKSTALEAKRIAKRKAQRKARKSNR